MKELLTQLHNALKTPCGIEFDTKKPPYTVVQDKWLQNPGGETHPPTIPCGRQHLGVGRSAIVFQVLLGRDVQLELYVLRQGSASTVGTVPGQIE